MVPKVSILLNPKSEHKARRKSSSLEILQTPQGTQDLLMLVHQTNRHGKINRQE